MLTYAHDLSIGSSQINAIDLKAGVAAAGHQVSLYASPVRWLIHRQRRLA